MSQLLEAPDMKQLAPGSQAEKDAYQAFREQREALATKKHQEVKDQLAASAVGGVVKPDVEREIRAGNRIEVVDQSQAQAEIPVQSTPVEPKE
jgi:hypothetical protein